MFGVASLLAQLAPRGEQLVLLDVGQDEVLLVGSTQIRPKL